MSILYSLIDFLPKYEEIGAGIVAYYYADVMAADWDIIKIGVNVSERGILFEAQSPAARAGAEAAQNGEKEDGGD